MRTFTFAIVAKLLLASLLLSPPLFADTQRGALNVEEEDASPSTFPWKLKFPNASLTDNGDGTTSVSLATGAYEFTTNGGSFFFSDTVNNRQLLTVSPSGKFLFPQYGAGILHTDASGNVTAIPPALNMLPVGDGVKFTPTLLPSCSNATTSKLLYDSSALAFSCGTDQTAAGGSGDVTDVGDCVGPICGTSAGATFTQFQFNPSSGTKYEWLNTGSSLYLTDYTNSRQLLQVEPGGKFVFPQYPTCTLKTVQGNVVCGDSIAPAIGSNTQILFNNQGSNAGDANLTYTKATQLVTTGSLTLASATPRLLFDGTTGTDFEWAKNGTSLFLADATNNKQLLTVSSTSTSSTLSFPQLSQGLLRTDASGNVSAFGVGNGSLLVGTTGSVPTLLPVGATNTVLISNGTLPSYSSTPTVAQATLNATTPLVTLDALSGTDYELGVDNSMLYLSDKTNNRQLLQVTPNGKFVFAQYPSCTLKTNAAGAVICSDDVDIPVGTDTQIYFNDKGSSAGSANLTFNKNNQLITTGSATFSSATPTVKLNTSVGNQYETTTFGSSYFLTDTTNNRQILQVNPSGKFVFPQYANCNLMTDANGNVICKGTAAPSYVVFSGCDGTYTTTFTDTPGGYCTTTASLSEMNQWQQAGTWSKLYVAVGQAPGAGKSWVCSFCINWWNGGFTCPLNCTISGATATSCSNTTQQVQSAVNDRVGLRCTSSAANNAINNNAWNVTFTPAS